MRKNIFIFRLILFFIVSLGAFSSCVTSKQVNYLQTPSRTIPSYSDTIKYKEYRLLEGDRISIQLISTDEKINTLFNGKNGNSSNTSDLYTYLIDKDGNVDLPVIGNVYILGNTLRESREKIRIALEPILSNIFDVNIHLTNRYFSIIGTQINSRFPITKEKMNIFQALALAGDVGTYGDRSKIKILRTVNGQPLLRTFDVRSKDIINSEYYYIQPNDVIYIQELRQRFFGITTVGNAISVFFSTLSFGVFIYDLVVPTTSTTTSTTTGK